MGAWEGQKYIDYDGYWKQPEFPLWFKILFWVTVIVVFVRW